MRSGCICRRRNVAATAERATHTPGGRCGGPRLSGGAQACGRKAGRIAVGHRADFTVIVAYAG